MHLTAAPGGSPAISVGGTYVGSVSELDRHLGELYRQAGFAPSSQYITERSFLEAMLYHRNALFLAQYSTVWDWPGSSQGIRNQYNWLLSYYKSMHPLASGQAYQKPA